MCTTCWTQGISQGAAAGSASGGVAMVAAVLSNLGLRGLGDRLVATRVEWVSSRVVKVFAAVVAMAVLAAVLLLMRPGPAA